MLMNAKQVAEYLGISYQHLMKMKQNSPERIPPWFQLTPSAPRWDEEEVRKWVKQRTREHTGR